MIVQSMARILFIKKTDSTYKLSERIKMKRHIYKYSRLMRLSLLVAFAAIGLAMAASPLAVFAQNNDGPKCAVVNFGEVACPVGQGNGTTNCYIRNPGATNSPDSNPDRWKQVDCNSDEWKAAAQAPAAIQCDQNDPEKAKSCDPSLACANSGNCDLVKKYVNPAIKALSALVGIAVTVSIVLGGIQYATSADDPSKVSAAKKRILNSILTLIGFFLFYQFLNWIIPGGL